MKRCDISEIEKYYDDRWINDQYRQSYRRSSNEDEGVEEDFSSSGSGVELNPTVSNNTRDFEELTQMMRTSLTGFENGIPTSSSNIAKTFC